MSVVADASVLIGLSSIGKLPSKELTADFVLQFLAIIERSRASHKPGTGMSSDEVRRHLGLK